jgi:predicted RNase H-like HicB family nuclease
MRSTIHFNIWREDGMYVAAAVDVPIATEGATFEELQENIRDVVAVYFEDEDLALLQEVRGEAMPQGVNGD